MTPAEKSLWHELRGNKLTGFHFRRQQVLRGFIADFYCHAARLVIEVDGRVHDLTGKRDAERDAALGEAGVRTLRFTNEQVMNHMGRVLKRILEAARERA